MKRDDTWRWQELGTTGAEERKALLALSSIYRQTPPPICYPGTLLDADLAELMGHLTMLHMNAIGTHTHGGVGVDGVWRPDPGEDGFEEIQRAEREVIWMISSVLGGSPMETDGHFCGGGTDANIEGLWMGREWCRSRGATSSDIAVLMTSLTHYSASDKAPNLLNLGPAIRKVCSTCGRAHLLEADPTGAGVQFVGMNERGEMDPDEFERICRDLYGKGLRRFIVVLTVGTTAMGSVDPIDKIDQRISSFATTLPGAHFYVHIDASFGGFTVPFVSDAPLWFQNPSVKSITLDADKMGRLPYPAGVVLCRKELQQLIARHVDYIGGHSDDTLPGSRSAIPALLGHYLFTRIGRSGQREYVQRCLDAREQLAHTLVQTFGSDPSSPVQLLPRSPWVNFLPLEIRLKNGEVPAEVLQGSILKPYCLHADNFPSNPRDHTSCPRIVYKICVMPHVTPAIERFVADLAEAVAAYKATV